MEVNASKAGPSPPSVSAVIINYESGRLLCDCIASLRDQGLLETIVVDNGSTDGSAAAATARFPNTKLIKPERNLGFAGGANFGAREARGELLLFLNPDIRLSPGSVRALADQFSDQGVGVVGPPLKIETSDAVEYGGTVDVFGSPVGLSERMSPLYVPGCALMTRTTLFRMLDGFDGRFFMFVEDVDYCWRLLLRGFDVRVVDHTPVRHQGGAAAPGGYVSDGVLASTSLRVTLRERNTLAMLLKCYGRPLAWLVVPFYVAQSLATAAVLAASDRRSTASAVVKGLGWNGRDLRRTLAMRHQVQASRRIGDRMILRRMYRGIAKLDVLMRFGIPSISEEGMTPVELDL